MALGLTACADDQVRVDEVAELEGLRGVKVMMGSAVAFDGLKAVTGVADGAQKPRLHFAVVVGDLPGPRTVPTRANLAGKSYRLVSGCAGAGFYTERGRRDAVASAVERAVYDKLAPDAYCEG